MDIAEFSCGQFGNTLLLTGCIGDSCLDAVPLLRTDNASLSEATATDLRTRAPLLSNPFGGTLVRVAVDHCLLWTNQSTAQELIYVLTTLSVLARWLHHFIA